MYPAAASVQADAKSKDYLKSSQTEIVKDVAAFKIPLPMPDPTPEPIIATQASVEPPKLQILQNLVESKNMDRIEDKLNQVLESINIISRSNLAPNSRSQIQIQAKAQLKKLSGLRTALYSTRRLTENIMEEALGCLESGRAKIKNFGNGSKEKVSETSTLGSDIEDFEFFLETVKKDLVNGSRPGPLYQNQIQKRLKELTEAYEKQNSAVMMTKSEQKKEWESSLQNILDQQQQVTDSCNEVEELSKRLNSAKDLALSILPVISFQQSQPLKLKTPELSVLDPEMIQEGMKKVLSELAFVKKKNENVDEMVEKIKKVKVSESNRFQAELEAFVVNGNLKDIGGISFLETRREKQLKELIYSHF